MNCPGVNCPAMNCPNAVTTDLWVLPVLLDFPSSAVATLLFHAESNAICVDALEGGGGLTQQNAYLTQIST